MSVTAHLVVQFTGGSSSGSDSSSLSAEVDSRIDGLNNGVTQFLPGQTANILVYTTGSAVVDQVLPSAGSISYVGEVPITIEETLQFINSDTANLRRRYVDNAQAVWLGNSLGTLDFVGSKAIASSPGVAIAKVSYRTVAQVYALSSPASLAGFHDFDILVVVVGHDDT